MREQTALVRTFDEKDNQLIQEYGTNAEETFVMPSRNWNSLIDDYNATNKKRFPLSSLECRKLVEYAKQGVPIIHVFEAIGVSNARYKNFATNAQEIEEKFQELAAKEFLSEEEFDFFHKLLRHPMRVLMADITKAEGISKVMDWEKWNANVDKYPEAQFAKMKARFKDYFSDKETQTNGINVQILLSGDWINTL